MKKISLIILMSIVSLLLNAQRDVVVGKHPNKFFNSYEDYKADKPIAGVVLTKWNDYSPFKSEISENGKTVTLKDLKGKYLWFCDDQGVLIRFYDNDLYHVIIDGGFTYYVVSSKSRVARYGDSEFDLSSRLDSPLADRYSETPNGEIKKFKMSILMEYLEKYGLKEQYDSDKIKREAKDNVGMYELKQQTKMLKYIKLLNEKMK
jgi:hypothetical protein